MREGDRGAVPQEGGRRHLRDWNARGRYFPERQTSCVRRSVSLGSPCGVVAAGRCRTLLTCPAPHLQVTAAPGGEGGGGGGSEAQPAQFGEDISLTSGWL